MGVNIWLSTSVSSDEIAKGKLHVPGESVGSKNGGQLYSWHGSNNCHFLLHRSVFCQP